MTSLAVVLAGISLLSVLALALAALAFCRAHSIARILARRPNDADCLAESSVPAFRAEIDGLAAQVHELQQAPAALPAAPNRTGINLNKRSQAIRLYRYGRNASQIASALDLAQQEVELLLKVHGIVIRNL